MRWQCICCALPRRVLEHIAKKTGSEHSARLAADHEVSQHVRAVRHEHKETDMQPPPGGHGRRFMYDAQSRMDKLPGRLVRKEGAKAARDRSVNEAYDNVGITLDFFRQVFKRKSLDGRDMDVRASVHFGDRWSNAMWNGEQMLFGDGDGEHILGFTQSLDIVAHELAHAVTQHTVGALGVTFKDGLPALIGESGALNESISDVFASMVKQWHGKVKAEDADWLLGEGILAPGIGKAVRSLEEPGKKKLTYGGDNQVSRMKDFRKKADVHRNSGIPNHAFFLAATELGGYSWERAGKIWYFALPHLKADAGFADAAKATLKTAADLYGNDSKEQRAVRKAWKKVGVLRR
jgi:Zn-dependent metalloprotease